MRDLLLISGYGDNGGGLYVYDGVRLFVVDFLMTTGLFYSNETLFRVAPIKRKNDAWCRVLTYRGSEPVSDRRFTSIAEPHDILIAGNKLLVVSAGANAIFEIQDDGQSTVHWAAPGEENSWHLNCLAVVDGNLWACAFGRFEKHREWEQHKKDGSGVLIDVKTGALIVGGLNCPHSPRVVGDRLFICDSATRRLLVLDLVGKSTIASPQFSGWTRGLAVAEDAIYVGESATRELPDVQHAAINVLNPVTLENVARISLPFREVYDLVLVPRTSPICRRMLGNRRTSLASSSSHA